MVVNRSAPPGAVVPSLVYDDVGRAVEWLCDVFGFRERLRWGPPKDVTAQVSVGDGAVFVRGRRVGHGSNTSLTFRPPTGGELSYSLAVRVDDVDAHFVRARDRGAVILLEPETYSFGERQYSAQDLGGHLWTFTQSVADISPEEWGAICA